MSIQKQYERAVQDGDYVLLRSNVTREGAGGWDVLAIGFVATTSGEYRVLLQQPEHTDSDGSDDMQTVVLTREQVLEIADKLRSH